MGRLDTKVTILSESTVFNKKIMRHAKNPPKSLINIIGTGLSHLL